ncbi:MAG TPA: hypothetical protein VGX23_26405 [Actinocrinis sp.]|nr:hypothetical protein [Actinocrinis sp.]
MSAIIIVIIAVIVVACVAVAYRASHRKKLRASFGPEYDQLVQAGGSSREADRELVRRKHEHAKLDLKPISEQDRVEFLQSWEHLQASFIDDPVFSMNSAENLVSRALEVRGYPGGDREEQLALLSVEYSGKLSDYRAAQDVKRRVEAGANDEVVTTADVDADSEAGVDPTAAASTTAATTAGPATTEDIRQALLAYRALFDELMSSSGTGVTRPPVPGTETGTGVGAETSGALGSVTVPAQEWSVPLDEPVNQKVEH